MDEIATLIEPQIPGLRRYAVALLRDREAADDLVQDTLERALAAWPQRRRDGDLRAWLFTIQRNLFLAGLRRRGRAAPQAGPDVLDIVPDRSSDPAAGLGLRDLFAGLDALPEDQRSVLLLVAVEDMSYADAAAVLDIPLGTVMSRLSRARERMRSFVETGRIGLLRRVK
ncbi:sigma-70 family RNA polymerase sigma factor [Methylobacterium sp. C25]|uniref:RNA polymerase sigma factor n=1 Tax=Methylobacterium sp. C25 TaxID=2721622 RepID=UPI001F2D07D1|nr:sigma-70 family RNA polymerase sigma factor [Methylobacterium sp. C25]MCE4226463.1 sigma-70 family RNA polymerase sigma factor [Methylobacterium sp. C25]